MQTLILFFFEYQALPLFALGLLTLPIGIVHAVFSIAGGSVKSLAILRMMLGISMSITVLYVLVILAGVNIERRLPTHEITLKTEVCQSELMQTLVASDSGCRFNASIKSKGEGYIIVTVGDRFHRIELCDVQSVQRRELLHYQGQFEELYSQNSFWFWLFNS